MIEYFLWQQFEGMCQLGAIFGPLFGARTPWWYYECAERREPGEPLYLLPRESVWLRFELPRHIERGHRIAKAILRDPFDADEAAPVGAACQTPRVLRSRGGQTWTVGIAKANRWLKARAVRTFAVGVTRRPSARRDCEL
jgi:hypothetical protein